MTDVQIDPALIAAHDENADRCMCQSYLRSTERAALAAARWLGRADQEAAEEAAAAGMRASLDVLPIRGRVVFGSFDDSVGLAPGETLGSGGVEVDLALDPLEGRGVVARGGNGAK
jgi:fructose-1,6-bisphosphatase/sedoheptulose 1,7-bisphosphatase-like protein